MKDVNKKGNNLLIIISDSVGISACGASSCKIKLGFEIVILEKYDI